MALLKFLKEPAPLTFTRTEKWVFIGLFKSLAIFLFLPLGLIRISTYPEYNHPNLYFPDLPQFLLAYIVIWLICCAFEVKPGRKHPPIAYFYLLWRSLPWLLACFALFAIPSFIPLYFCLALFLQLLWFSQNFWPETGWHLQQKRSKEIRSGWVFRQTVIWIGISALLYGTAYLVFLMPVPRCCGGDKVSSVKANMHTLQTMAETFFADKGRVARNLKELKKDALTSSSPYWKDFTNPYTSLITRPDHKHPDPYLVRDEIDLQNHPFFKEIMGFRFIIKEAPIGVVSYEYQSNQNYAIYGYNRWGLKIRDKGQILQFSPE